MNVRNMRIGMLAWLMAVPMAVGALGHDIVAVVVVPILMPMRVLVLKCFVLVPVLMSLALVHQHAREH